MRGIGRLSAAPNTKQTFLSTATASSHALSTFSGRGRGRGLSHPSTAAPDGPQPDPTPDDSLLPAAVGYGRGRGRGHGLTPSPPPPPPSSSVTPSFSPFMTPVAPGGRGRGMAFPSAPPPQILSSEPERPAISRIHGPVGDMATPPTPDRPLNISLGPPGASRGKQMKMPTTASKPPIVNRHLRQRPADVAPRRGRGGRASPRMGRGAESVGVGSGDSRTGLGRGRGRGRRGRESYARGGGGGRFAPLRPEVEDEDENEEVYLSNDADGERLKKRLGEEEAQQFQELLDEASYAALPCPMEDAYNDAVRMNYRIEFEPEYLMEFNKNPDIDEAPPISLREALEKMKPFLMEYEGIESEGNWEEAINDVMKKAPALKRIVDEYGGPDVITTKQQQEELERVAKSVPENTPSSVKKFADRALLSLQSNPGWDFYKKKLFMDSMVAKFSQHYSGNK